jgi:hypothetical protein
METTQNTPKMFTPGRIEAVHVSKEDMLRHLDEILGMNRGVYEVDYILNWAGFGIIGTDENGYKHVLECWTLPDEPTRLRGYTYNVYAGYLRSMPFRMKDIPLVAFDKGNGFATIIYECLETTDPEIKDRVASA